MTCGVCTAETPTGYTLCTRDRGNLERHLAELDNTIQELRTTMARQDTGAPSLGGGASTPQPAMNLDAFEAYEQLREVIVGWAVNLQGRAFYWLAKTEEAASYLLKNLDMVCRQYWAPDLALELTAAVRDAVNVTDRAADKVSLGICGNVVEGIECTDTITAIVGAPFARCRTCGISVNAHAHQQIMIAQAWHVRGDLPEILRALKAHGSINIPLERAKKWVQRGHLKPGPDGKHSPASIRAYYLTTRHGRKELADVA